MAKKLTDIVNINNPAFLKEYEGYYIGAPEGTYQIQGGKVNLTPNEKFFKTATNPTGINYQDISNRYIGFDEKGGLQPAGKGSYQTSEAFRYFGAGTIPQEQIASNFGMGSQPDFRPREANESVDAYLRAKQAAGNTGIDLGSPNLNPTKEQQEANWKENQTFNAASAGKSEAGAYQYGTDVLGKKANDAAVNTLYNSYFGRNANAAELKNWGSQGGADTTVKALEDFLQAERTNPKNDLSKLPTIKPIGEIKSEYEKMSPLPEVPSATDLGTGNADISTTTNPIPLWEAKATGLQSQIDKLQSDMEARYKLDEAKYQKEADKIKAEQQEYRDLQKEMIDKTSPEALRTEQQDTIYKNRLDAAEYASTKLLEDYKLERDLVLELRNLGDQALSEIEAVKNVTGLSAIRTPRINKTINDWEGKLAMKQAALAAVRGQMSSSKTYLDDAEASITARNKQEVDYYNSLSKYYDSLAGDKKDELAEANRKKQEAADNQAKIKQAEIDDLKDTFTLIKNEMINDPARIAGAGINLATDNLETITKKLADWDYGKEVIDKKNTMEAEGYTYLSNLNGITSENQITRIKDSRGVERIYKNPPENKSGSINNNSNNISDDISDFDYARQIIDANTNVSDAELKTGLLELVNEKKIKLNATEINSLIEERKEKAETQAEANKPQPFSEDWFKLKIETARSNDFSDTEIVDYILTNFDKNELFKTAKEAGFAEWYTGKKTDIKRYIESLL